MGRRMATPLVTPSSRAPGNELARVVACRISVGTMGTVCRISRGRP